MVILSLLDLAAGWILQGHAALQATGHSGGRTGQHLDAVQRRHPASWYPSLIEGLASLHTAVDIHPHGWQRVQVEAAQTVPSGVVAKSALGADPVWEDASEPVHCPTAASWAGETQSYGDRQEDAGRRDFRIGSGVFDQRDRAHQRFALVIHEDPPVGNRQFWVTVPCRWPSLLAAKTLFVLAFIHLPYFVANVVNLWTRGFPPFAWIPYDLLHHDAYDSLFQPHVRRR